MPKQSGDGNQASQYDKVIKENLEVTLPVIIRDVLGLDIVHSEELQDDIQHTKERKPDALKKVTDTAGHTYVLQVEFRIGDEKGNGLSHGRIQCNADAQIPASC